jgi:hypothetical protein
MKWSIRHREVKLKNARVRNIRYVLAFFIIVFLYEGFYIFSPSLNYQMNTSAILTLYIYIYIQFLGLEFVFLFPTDLFLGFFIFKVLFSFAW